MTACSGLSPQIQAKPRRAFSLIEAAIVLAVVGVVIGGIWVAASSIQQKRLVTNLQAGVFSAAQNMRRLVPPYMYPTSCCATVSVAGLMTNGILPKDYVYVPSNGTYLSAEGVRLNILIGYTTKPYFKVILWNNPAGFNEAACVAFIRSSYGTLRDRTKVDYIQINHNSSGATFVYPPITPSTVINCTDFSFIEIWYLEIR